MCEMSNIMRLMWCLDVDTRELIVVYSCLVTNIQRGKHRRESALGNMSLDLSKVSSLGLICKHCMQVLGHFEAEYDECHFKLVGDKLENREYDKTSLKRLSGQDVRWRTLQARRFTTDSRVYETILAMLTLVGPIQLVAVRCNSLRCWPG